MLTIGQVAAHVGVTVRAVRHYHRIGLLAEPERDHSGYRRYGGNDVLQLIRIKTLSEAGVPLARTKELMDADPEQFAEAVAEIEKALTVRIRDLKEHRRRVAQLAGGERLFLPDDVVDYLEHLRALGVSARTVLAERDGWIMLMALSPELARPLLEEKRSALDQADFQALYLAYDRAADWHPSDPRLEGIADSTVAFLLRGTPSTGQDPTVGSAEVPLHIAPLVSDLGGRTPSWERLEALCQDRLRSSADPTSAGV